MSGRSKLAEKRCARLTILAAAAWLAALCPAWADDQAVSEAIDRQAAGFRRVFVPADRPQQWPTHGDRYLPIDRDEFQRLVDAAIDRHKLRAVGAAQIRSASHEATLQSDSSLRGKSVLQVSLIDDAPQVLSLSPLNVVVRDVHWQLAGGEQGAAVVGMWANSETGELAYGVLVEQSGRLELEWSLPQRATATAADLEYSLVLPRALEQQLVLDLPANHDASVSSATVASRQAANGSPRSLTTFLLGGDAAHRLQISRPAAAQSQSASLPRVSVVEALRVAPQGLEYEVAYRVQLRSAAPQDFRLGVPSSLRVAKVLVNRSPAKWETSGAGEPSIRVPLPRTTAPIDITILAAGDLVLNQPWRLPKLAPENVFWTEATTALWVDPSLELQGITPREASLLNHVGIGRTDGGEAYRLQAWSSDASTEVVLAERPPALNVQTGVTAEFADRELVGKCQARLWTDSRPLLHLEAEIEPHWNLETVEAQPPQDLVQWHVADERGARRLHLQLRRSPTEANPLTLTLSARKPLRGWAPSATVGELNWIRFSAVDATDGKLLITDRRGGKLSLAQPPAGALLSVDSLSTIERELFKPAASGLLLATSVVPRDATVSVQASQPRFNGEAWIELARLPTGFQHTAEIQIRPLGTAVSDFVVAATRPLPPDAHWTVSNSDEQPAVQTLAESEQEVGSPDSVAHYRVRLPTPRSAPIRLRVSWRSNEPAVESINSLTLPRAVQWESWAILRGNPAEARVDGRGATPAVALSGIAAADESPPVLGCFRLGDEPAVHVARTPQLKVGPANSANHAPGVTCWMLESTTLQFADGHQTHRLAYDLQIHRADVLQVDVPRGFEVVSVRLDGEIGKVDRTTADTDLVRIEVDQAVHRRTLTLDLQTRPRPLELGAVISPPLPRASFPVARCRWTVASPAPHAVEIEGRQPPNAGWRQRLFGPLVDAPRLNPLSRIQPQASALQETQAARTTADGMIPQQWRSATQEFVTSPAGVRIWRVDEARASRHALWLISAALAAIAWPTMRRAIVAVVAVAALLCLVLPLAWIVLPQAVLLGVLAGAVLRELLSRTRRPPRTGASLALRGAALAMLASLAHLANPSAACAVDGAAPPPAVMYPVDADGKPEGADLYVPAALLSRLLPSSSHVRHSGAAYAIEDARYQLDLEEDAAAGEVVCRRCTLRFRVKTFHPQVAVRLPLHRQDGDWKSAAITLDGEATTLRWQEDGVGCVLDVARPGTHEIVLAFSPKTNDASGDNALSVRVPPFPGAIVEVNHPATLDRLLVDSVQLAPAPPATRTTARISPVDRLEAAWPRRLVSSTAGISVDQLSWLEVDPVAATLDLRLRFTGNVAALPSLELLVPAQLKLLPLSENSPVLEARSDSGMPNIVKLKLRTPPQEGQVIHLPFQIQRSVSLGQIDFPMIRAVGVTTGRNHFAATIDPRLRLREETSEGLAPLSVTELENSWGTFGEAPSAQYVASALDPAWAMQFEPAPTSLTVREGLAMLCAADHAQATYTANVDVVQGNVIIHRLTIPADLQVDSVNITLEGTAGTVPVRWSRPVPDQITIFLSRPLDDRHRVQLVGRIAYDDDRQFRIPRFAMESGASPIDVAVNRTSDVLVRPVNGWELDPPAAVSAGDAEGLPVGRYAVSRTEEAMPELKVDENTVRLVADGLLMLDLSAPKPRGQLLLRGRVSRGVVDHLRLLTSDRWRGPFRVEPQATATIAAAPGDETLHVIEIKLPAPVSAGEEFQVSLSGDLALESDQRVRFPQVRLLGAAEQQLYLAIPETPRNQTAEWTRRGLERQQLPRSLAEVAGLAPSQEAYRVVGPDFLAEQRLFPDALRTASVRLATTRVMLDDRGHWSALSELIVQPGGASDIVVKLPEDTELFYAGVDGRPVPFQGAPRDSLTLRQGSRYLPRLVTVGYRNTADPGSRLELAAPQVLIDNRNAAVERALWQIEGDSAANLMSINAVAPLAHRSFQSTARRIQIDAVVDASALAFQLPQWELQRWFEPWLVLLGAGPKPEPASDAAHERDWAQLRERIGPVGSATTSLETTPAFSSPTGYSACYLGAPDGRLTLVQARAGFGFGRWLLALAIAGAIAVAWRAPAKLASAVNLIRRRPVIVGIAVGLFWWFYLTPSVLGPAIVALSLAAYFRIRQQQSSQRRHFIERRLHEGSTASLVQPGH